MVQSSIMWDLSDFFSGISIYILYFFKKSLFTTLPFVVFFYNLPFFNEVALSVDSCNICFLWVPFLDLPYIFRFLMMNRAHWTGCMKLNCFYHSWKIHMQKVCWEFLSPHSSFFFQFLTMPFFVMFPLFYIIIVCLIICVRVLKHAAKKMFSVFLPSMDPCVLLHTWIRKNQFHKLSLI